MGFLMCGVRNQIRALSEQHSASTNADTLDNTPCFHIACHHAKSVTSQHKDHDHNDQYNDQHNKHEHQEHPEPPQVGCEPASGSLVFIEPFEPVKQGVWNYRTP